MIEQSVTISYALAIAVGIIGALITALGFLLYGNFLELKKMVRGLMENDADKEVRLSITEGDVERLKLKQATEDELNHKVDKALGMLSYLTDSPNVNYRK